MKKVLLPLILGCASIFFVLLFMELGLRFIDYPFSSRWEPQETSIGQYDAGTGWSYKPNFSATVKAGDPKRDISYHFNDMGVRTLNTSVIFDPQQPTIFFIGGSVTMGHGLNYEDSYAGLVATKIGGTCQVINLGVQGFGTDQSLLLLNRHLENYNTVAVIYTFIDDHILRNSVSDRRFLYRSARFISTKPFFKLNENRKPYLDQKPYEIKSSHELNLWSLYRLARYNLGRKNRKVDDLSLTTSLISEMKYQSESNDAEFYVLYWRDRGSDDDILGEFNKIDLNVIDIKPNLPPDWEQWRLPDKHPDARGAAHGANMLLQNLGPKVLSKCGVMTN